jgi:RpiR family carbohydrate utilization transcriptional regulator
MARQRGATVIGVTRSDTELAALCTIAIAVDPIEDTFIYAPMVARVAHLVIVDILATSVALSLGPAISEQFRYVKESLRDQWIGEAAEPPASKKSKTSGATGAA